MVSKRKSKWRLRKGDWVKFRDMIGNVCLDGEGNVNEMNRELVSKVKQVAEVSVRRGKGYTE